MYRCSVSATCVAFVLAVCFFVGCTGGQTGEITRPTSCDQRIGTLAFNETGFDVSTSAAEQIAPFLFESEARVVWNDGSSSMSRLSIAAREGHDVQVLGPGQCARTLSAPILVTLESNEEVLRLPFVGTIELNVPDRHLLNSTSALVSLALTEVEGNVPVDLEAEGVELGGARLALTLAIESEVTRGLLWLRVADESVDEIPVGSW